MVTVPWQDSFSLPLLPHSKNNHRVKAAYSTEQEHQITQRTIVYKKKTKEYTYSLGSEWCKDSRVAHNQDTKLMQ